MPFYLVSCFTRKKFKISANLFKNVNEKNVKKEIKYIILYLVPVP